MFAAAILVGKFSDRKNSEAESFQLKPVRYEWQEMLPMFQSLSIEHQVLATEISNFLRLKNKWTAGNCLDFLQRMARDHTHRSIRKECLGWSKVPKQDWDPFWMKDDC